MELQRMIRWLSTKKNDTMGGAPDQGSGITMMLEWTVAQGKANRPLQPNNEPRNSPMHVIWTFATWQR